jgi:DNA-binding transcriptional MerR regulator
MTTPAEVKNIARQLYQEGHKPSFIAERCDVSLRTIRRWVRSFEQETVKVTGRTDSPSSTEVLPALERIAITSSDSVSVNIIPSTAVRLLNLAQASIAAVEGVLYNPDSSDANKLKAASLASKWVGLESSSGKALNPSVVETIAKKAGVAMSVESSEASEIQLTSTMIKNKRLFEMQQAEKERRRAEEERRRAEEAQREAEQEELEEKMYELAERIAKRGDITDYTEIVKCPKFDGERFLHYLLLDFTELDEAERIAGDILKLRFISDSTHEEFIGWINNIRKSRAKESS